MLSPYLWRLMPLDAIGIPIVNIRSHPWKHIHNHYLPDDTTLTNHLVTQGSSKLLGSNCLSRSRLTRPLEATASWSSGSFQGRVQQFNMNPFDSHRKP